MCYHAIKNKFLEQEIPENKQGNVKVNLWTNLCIQDLVKRAKIRVNMDILYTKMTDKKIGEEMA